jgi:hypothetical protein
MHLRIGITRRERVGGVGHVPPRSKEIKDLIGNPSCQRMKEIKDFIQLLSMPVATMSFCALTAFACVSTRFVRICLCKCYTQQAYPLYESISTIQFHCFYGCWLEPLGLAIASTTTMPWWMSCLALSRCSKFRLTPSGSRTWTVPSESRNS